MAANQNTPQGTLNRLRGSVVFDQNRHLNITSDYLTPGAIQLSPLSRATDPLETMTGLAQSPAAKLLMRVTVHLVRSQDMVDVFTQQYFTNTLLGPARVRSDSTTQQDFTLKNCALIDYADQNLGGTQVEFTITLEGYVDINDVMWAAS